MVRTPLDLKATLEFVRHKLSQSPDGYLGIEHAESVACDVATLSANYFAVTRGPCFVPGRHELPETLEHAALLHEMISHCGASYDELLEVTNSDVADVVAAITPDMRLPEPKRVLDYRGQLSGFSPGLTALILCDIANHVADMFGAESFDGQDDATLALFSVKAERLLEDLNVLRYSRSGMLGDYRRSITAMLVDGRNRIGQHLRASHLKASIAKNIQKRTRKEPKNGK